MKKTLVIMMVIAIAVSITGCGVRTSSYKAVGFVHTSGTDFAQMSFHSFEGRMVFKLRSRGEGELKYKAELESGAAAVYYEFQGSGSELFTIRGGDSVDSHGGYVENGMVYVIVETDGKCMNGWFEISLE